jgi:hypothetical protein
MMASAYALAGHVERARGEVVAAHAIWPYGTVRSFMADYVANETVAAQVERVGEGLRLAGLCDHVDVDANFGIVPDSSLRTEIVGEAPLTAPGASTIQTTELAALIHDGKPVVIDASEGNQTLADAISLYEAGLGGTLQDAVQARLRPLVATLTGENFCFLDVRNGYRGFLAELASPFDGLPCGSIILWFD